ncbi:MAG TPA: TolC family protein [Thermoanaerobaculia bacterium]|nr:TolC family protein [Thermoanaerobaculia bacterium]
MLRIVRRMLIASLLLAPALFAQPLTLRDAAAEALAHNPRAAVAAAEDRAARARLQEARAAWLPVVGASASALRGDNPVFVFGSLLEQGRFAAQHFDPNFLNDPPVIRHDRLTLNVKYALFDQLRRFDGTKQARHGVTRAERAADETRQQILSDVISRYYGLAVAEQRRVVAAEAVRAAEAAANATRDKVEQGLVVESDRLAAEVQLAQFRQQEIAAAGDADIARAALAMTLHRPLTEPIVVESTLPETELATIGLAEATEQAWRSRGELASAEAARAASELRLRTARGSLLPRVDGFATWSNSDHTMGLVAGIDLFDAGKYARIAEARANVEGARAMEAMTRDKVVMETIAAWNRANAARQQVGVAAIAVQQAEAASRIVQDRYDNGLTTITEVLRAQTALVGARLALLDARYQAVTGHAELLRSTGGLRDIDLVWTHGT